MAAADEVTSRLSRDPVMRELVREHGSLELSPADDAFKRLVVSVVRQQVSTASAEAIRERLFSRFDVEPETLLESDHYELTGVGLSGRKAEYVQNIAEAHVEQGFGPGYFAGQPDDKVVEELTGIRGVGDWTAKMYLMFCLGREDVFPVEDLGIRRGIEALYGFESRDEKRDKSLDWKPYRSYASLYIWRAHED